MAERVVLIYSTIPSRKEATDIASALVEKRLAACVNIGLIHSVYRWEAKIQRDREYSLLVKTTEGRVADAVSLIRSLHSYTTPAIVWWTVDGGDVQFLEWIRREVGETDDDSGSP